MNQMKKPSLAGPIKKQFQALSVLILLAVIFSSKVGFAQPAAQPVAQPIQIHPGALALGENTIADVAQAAAPAVVNVEVAFETTIAKLPVVKGGQTNPFNEKVPQNTNPTKGFAPKVVGSGLVVRPDGYIVTN